MIYACYTQANLNQAATGQMRQFSNILRHIPNCVPLDHSDDEISVLIRDIGIYLNRDEPASRLEVSSSEETGPQST